MKDCFESTDGRGAVLVCSVDAYELRSIEGGFELSGGKLSEPLIYRETEPAPAIHLVGFLSQRDGSELRVLDRAGHLIQTRRFRSTVIMHGDGRRSGRPDGLKSRIQSTAPAVRKPQPQGLP